MIGVPSDNLPKPARAKDMLELNIVKSDERRAVDRSTVDCSLMAYWRNSMVHRHRQRPDSSRTRRHRVDPHYDITDF
jgi:hypothetical protein